MKVRRQWRTEVRRYEGNPKATAARFDKTEPAATKSESTATSKAPISRRRGGRYKVKS
jgi:hypothetical protein